MHSNLGTEESSGAQLKWGIPTEGLPVSPAQEEERLTTERSFSHPIPETISDDEEERFIHRGLE